MGAHPGGTSLTTAPISRHPVEQPRVRLRVGTVDAPGEDGDRDALDGQGSPVRGRVDAEGRAARRR